MLRKGPGGQRYVHFPYIADIDFERAAAVTLEGTVIHKSGLMTGGRSSHGNGKKWEENDVQGLQRLRDKLMADLQELNKTKPRGKADDNLLAEITRLEPALTVTRDDLVRRNLLDSRC